MNNIRKKYTVDYLSAIKETLDTMESDLTEKMDALASVLMSARVNRNTVFAMGNGGSAATASHFIEDLAKCTIAEGLPRFKALALTDNISGILAWANDSCYEDIFIEQLKNLLEPDDVVIGISGSGNSMNVIRAIEYANDNGAVTVGLSGYDGGKLAGCARLNIRVPCSNMQRVEDLHVLVLHLITSIIRDVG